MVAQTDLQWVISWADSTALLSVAQRELRKAEQMAAEMEIQ